MSSAIVNAFTIDVEDYFQVSAFERYIGRSDWDSLPCRVERNVDLILEMLDRHRVKATFFTLGWIAERYPDMVKRLVREGHELASHGYAHVRVTGQTPEEFFEDVVRTKRILEDVGGGAVLGYRAASYSIGAGNLWALERLHAAGYVYSSSIYPIRHDLYGMPEAPRFAFRPRDAGGILEVPISTVELMNHKLPCGGGGYFRLLPYPVSRWALRRVNEHDGQPAVFYFHPWEVDPDQPRQRGLDMKTRFRHYFNLRRMVSRLERLLHDFRWGRMDQIYLGAGRS